MSSVQPHVLSIMYVCMYVSWKALSGVAPVRGGKIFAFGDLFRSSNSLPPICDICVYVLITPLHVHSGEIGNLSPAQIRVAGNAL